MEGWILCSLGKCQSVNKYINHKQFNLHCMRYVKMCILYVVHCTSYSVICTVYVVQCTMNSRIHTYTLYVMVYVNPCRNTYSYIISYVMNNIQSRLQPSLEAGDYFYNIQSIVLFTVFNIIHWAVGGTVQCTFCMYRGFGCTRCTMYIGVSHKYI